MAVQDSIASLATAIAALSLKHETVYGSDLYRRAQAILRLLTPQDVDGVGFKRVGGANDGGYVMLDDITASTTPIAYSIGINRDVTWDTDIAAQGIDVFMYDHTIDALPSSNPRFHFRRQGLTGSMAGEALLTLAEMLEANRHGEEPRMLLKIDIEGAEWDALWHAPPDLLSRFSQIVIEFHGLIPTTQDDYGTRIQGVLQKLLQTHQPVHIHANTYGPSLILPGLVLPWGAEVTYASRSVYGSRLRASSRFFPTAWDASNRRDRCDMPLGDAGRSLAARQIPEAGS